MRVLMVCLGNICRSPTAEAALREALADTGVEGVEVDSAGIGDWHAGGPPDPRMVAAAAAEGLTVSGTARQVRRRDFDDFDLVLALDRAVRDDLLALAPDDAARAKVRLFRDFVAEARDPSDPATGDVPDPYYGGPDGFAEVVRIARSGARGLVRHLLANERVD